MLLRHRKVAFAAHDLGIDPIMMVGHLTVFWHAVLEQQEDGDLSDWPDALIEQAAGWKGEPGKFLDVLRHREWLDGSLVHDWLDYTGKYLHAKYNTSNPQLLKHIYLKHGYKYGKGKGKYGKVQVQSKCRVSADQVPTKCSNLNLNLNPSSSSSSLRSEEDSEKKEPPLPPVPGGSVSVPWVVTTWNQVPGVKPCAEKPMGFIADRITSAIKKHTESGWWVSYFAEIAESDFLCGRSNDFAATLDWVLGPKNMAKILAGNYRNKSPAVSGTGLSPPRPTCQQRVQRGTFLKPCGEPSVETVRGRPLCQAHKEQHDADAADSRALAVVTA